MSNQWFRMYSEFAFDPKVQVLTEVLQRRYVMALCLHCDGKLENRPDDEIALALRVTVEDWVVTKKSLIERCLLDDETLTPAGWNKRQFISDMKDPTAAKRQARYRDKKRNDTVTSRSPESDTDTEADKKKSSRGSRFTLTQPPDDWIQFCITQRPDINPGRTFDTFRDYWIAKPGKDGVKLDWQATWKNWVRNQKSTNGAGYGNQQSKFRTGLEGIAAARAKRLAAEQGQA